MYLADSVFPVPGSPLNKNLFTRELFFVDLIIFKISSLISFGKGIFSEFKLTFFKKPKSKSCIWGTKTLLSPAKRPNMYSAIW